MKEDRYRNANNLFANETYEGEDIHQKIDRILTTDQPIQEDPNLQKIYTKRKDGVIDALNIRTDKWDLALEAMDNVNKTKIAKAEAYTESVEPTPKNDEE